MLPPDLRDWVPEQHLVHFVVDAVEDLPVVGFKVNHRGTGDAQYPPVMMLSLLIYCYATGRFSSREKEVQLLMEKAEEADREKRQPVVNIPDEIARREERREKLLEARKIIEARFEEKRREEQAEYDAQQAHREAERAAGRKPRGSEPTPPASQPPDKAQYNFTDPASRIMKAGSGNHFEQSYNAQAAVDIEGSMLVLGKRVTDHPNDKAELVPTVAVIDPAIRQVTATAADTGRQSHLRQAQGNGRARVRNHQRSHGLPPFSAPGHREGLIGMELGDLGLQCQASVPPPEPPSDSKSSCCSKARGCVFHLTPSAAARREGRLPVIPGD